MAAFALQRLKARDFGERAVALELHTKLFKYMKKIHFCT